MTNTESARVEYAKVVDTLAKSVLDRLQKETAPSDATLEAVRVLSDAMTRL